MTSTPNASRLAATAVNQDRLWDSLMRFAEFGATGTTGVSRLALSAADMAARAHVAAWAGERGFSTSVDGIGNLFVGRGGTSSGATPVLTGSHMDSQPDGGRFDGIYGFVAGLEVLEALDEAGVATRRPIEVAAWTNEEGSRFEPGCMGSMAFAGTAKLEDFAATVDAAGTSFAAALAECLATTPTAERRPTGFPAAAYVEAHIEQGPVLELAGIPVGVVSGIQGADRFAVTIEGETGHAGTVPVSLRRDAMQAAVRALNALNVAMADADDILRLTVGRLDVTPNSPNTVPGRVYFSVDLRHPDGAELERRGGLIEAACKAAAAPCTVSVERIFAMPPRIFDENVRQTIARAAAALEVPVMDLPSGALHDAGFLCDACPTGMIFVPCRGGISHNEAEYATPEHAATGARVLAATLVSLAGA